MVDAPGGLVLASRRIEGSSESSVPESGKESLNFKVSPEFKKEFKGFAVSEGISMTELLKEGFALSKKTLEKEAAEMIAQPAPPLALRTQTTRWWRA